jgi:hypothetical protein
MSLGKIYRFYNEKYREEISETQVDISKLIIPFSRMFKKYENYDIYSGKEKIPFKKRNPEYKMILKQEFKN